MNFISELLSFVTFRGSRAHLDSISVPLAERVRDKAVAVVNICENGSWVARLNLRAPEGLTDIKFIPRELGDKRLGDALSSDVISAIRSRSSSGGVIVGVSALVESRMSEWDEQLAEGLRSGDLIEGRPERIFVIGDEKNRRMIQYPVAIGQVESLERACIENSFTLMRLLVVPGLLMNILLGSSGLRNLEMVQTATQRVPMVLDESSVQMLSLGGIDRAWANYRSTDIFGKKYLGVEAKQEESRRDALLKLLTSMHRQVKPSTPVELLVFSTSSGPAPWEALESVVKKLNASRDLSTELVLRRVIDQPHAALHALCLHV